MIQSSTCSCRPSITHGPTGRHLLIQGRVYVNPNLHMSACRSLPSIRFGSGLALNHFDGFERMDDVARNMPHGLKQPFEKYSNEGLTHINIQVDWPNHGKNRVPYGVDIDLKDRWGNEITTADLWQKASRAITEAMERLAKAGTQGDCCWAVSTGPSSKGLRRCCVYLVELTYLGGNTYQPEIHVARCASHSSTDRPEDINDASGYEYIPPSESRFPISNERTDISARSPSPLRVTVIPLRSQSVMTSSSQSSFRTYRVD